MRNVFKMLTISAATALLLSGCFGSSPTTRYYALDSDPVAPNKKDISLGIGPFEVPEYLNRPQIVVRGDGNKLIMYEFDRWAENIEMGISRRVATEVTNLNKDVFVYEFIRTSSFPGDYRVFGQIIKFEANIDNSVTLEVTWGLGKIKSKQINPDNRGRRTVYRTEIQSADDIEAVTEAMAELLDQFSVDISAAMDEMLAEEERLAADEANS